MSSKFDNIPGFSEFKHCYRKATEDEMALFLGAGVNLPVEGGVKNFKTYSWPGLLEAIYLQVADKHAESFEQIEHRYSNDWELLATEVTKPIKCQAKRIELVDGLLYKGFKRTQKYYRAPRYVFDHAPSLHAAICFSAKIKARNRTAKGNVNWTFKRNPKIGAIITTNYDFFFCAGWTNYQSFRSHWKVSTPFPSNTRRIRKSQRQIFYIHGYIPFRLGPRKKIVLTKESYEEFYGATGKASQRLEKLLADYNIIFIGLSFDDKRLNEVIARQRRVSGRQHFAIVKNRTASKCKQLEITPVIVESFADVPLLLENCYTSAISKQQMSDVSINTKKEYWQRLKKGPTK